jgi:hypothetical protein
MMQKILLLLLFYIPVVFCQSTDTTITELRGIEDQNGNTHLFYRINLSWGNDNNGGFNKSIYHLDLYTNSDSLFLSSTGLMNQLFFYHTYIYDYEFWHNDPLEYIFIGLDCADECSGFIEKSDFMHLYSSMTFTPGPKLAISNNNDSILFCSASNYFLKSIDGGRNWFIPYSSDYLNLLSLSPYNDNIVFALDLNGFIEKSSDGGKTFYIVDTTLSTTKIESAYLYYDIDSIHIYEIKLGKEGGKLGPYLVVSHNKGELNTWSKKYSGVNSLFLSVDYSKSGTIYLADGKNIFVSTNYADSFLPYKSLDSIIVGIYKKPGSDKLYTATKNDIYEITSTSIKSIKHIITSVSNKFPVPQSFILYQNYPNPFNPSTTISYEIPKSGLVQLKIYNILGREIATLVNENQSAGEHSIIFNPQKTKNSISSGIYFYRLKFGSSVLSQKMILLK